MKLSEIIDKLEWKSTWHRAQAQSIQEAIDILQEVETDKENTE
jgi:hypothetical protein